MKEARRRGSAYTGTSGWAYKEWRGKFYPRGLRQVDELAYTAEHLATVEMNSPFYRLQTPRLYEQWRNQVPAAFPLAVKGWRGVTHFKKLRDAEGAIGQFFGSGVLELGESLGPVLWQLPPSLGFDASVLEGFLGALPKTLGDAAGLAETPPGIPSRLRDQPIRYAVEPRNASFEATEAIEILSRHNAALVMADSAGKHPFFDHVTADFTYVRLHGSPRIYYSNYSEADLEEWAARLRPMLEAGRDCYVYFDNTAAGHAPTNALALEHLLGADARA